jgi:hypothetical protein
VVDTYALYAEWFGGYRGGFQEINDANWDARPGAGLAAAGVIVVALIYVAWAWPRVARRVHADLEQLRVARHH